MGALAPHPAAFATAFIGSTIMYFYFRSPQVIDNGEVMIENVYGQSCGKKINDSRLILIGN